MVRRAFKILQQMMLNLIINLESTRFSKVCDDFVELGIKCQVYIMAANIHKHLRAQALKWTKEVMKYEIFLKIKKLTGYWKMH